MLPGIIECGNNIYMVLTPAQINTNLQILLRAAGTEDMKLYTRLRGPASHTMDRTAMGHFMGYVG